MSRLFRNNRNLSLAAFSFLFAYLMSFLFEGRVLYSTIEAFGAQAESYIFTSIIAHFAGLFSCGYFIKAQRQAKRSMLIYMAVCLLATVPFFFAPSALWNFGLAVAGFAAGWAVAAWGFFLKAHTPKRERIKTCADVLICSNLLMIIINVITEYTSHGIGIILSMLCLIIGGVLTLPLPDESEQPLE